ncbi:MAG: hypothetical protein ACYDAL_11240 [Candidatus Dormibacteraceae bacterium]
MASFPTLLFHGAAAAATALQAASWISFFAPSGILGAGGLPDVGSFAALLAWLAACSPMMMRRSGSVASPAA